MMKLKTVGVTALAAVACAVVAAPIGAQQPAKPAPCNGMFVSDPAGDQKYYVLGNQTPAAGPENGDQLGLFMNRTGSKTQAAMVIANLSKKIPEGSDSIVYRIFYDLGDVTHYLEASIFVIAPEEVRFSYGRLTTTLTEDGETPGKFVEGEQGVIQWDVPAAAGGKSGDKWDNVYSFASFGRGAIVTPSDYAPDSGSTGEGPTWSGAQCPSAGSPAGPGDGGATTPPPGTTPPPAPDGETTKAKAFQVKVTPLSFKAKKVKKAKKLSFSVTTGERVTDLALTLKKGSKSLGSAKLVTLEGSGRLGVKLAKKGLKKGSYTLVLTAKRSDGSPATVDYSVRVK
jgi:hypothetical protein